jgi:hypothetical protein
LECDLAEDLPVFYVEGGSVDELILYAYWLGHFYHCDPQVFLDKTLPELKRQLYWTRQLQNRIAAEQEMAERMRGG